LQILSKVKLENLDGCFYNPKKKETTSQKEVASASSKL
jgi:hypothetical protein